MSDLYLFFGLLFLLGRGVGTSPLQLSEATGCTLYRARKLFRELVEADILKRQGNTYRVKPESKLVRRMHSLKPIWSRSERLAR